MSASSVADGDCRRPEPRVVLPRILSLVVRPTPDIKNRVYVCLHSNISREVAELMDPQPSPRPRKRRAINACVNCRTSKVRCDGSRPCQRCDRNDAVCIYHDVVKDENVLRIEKLEAEMIAMRQRLDHISSQSNSVR